MKGMKAEDGCRKESGLRRNGSAGKKSIKATPMAPQKAENARTVAKLVPARATQLHNNTR